MADNKLNEAAWDLVNSYRETSQRVAEDIVAAQERNMKLAQSTFMNWMEVLQSHTESTMAIVQELEQQNQKQQEAYQRLVYASLDIYMKFLQSPLSYYRQMVNAAETATQLGLESAQKVTREAMRMTKKKSDL